MLVPLAASRLPLEAHGRDESGGNPAGAAVERPRTEKRQH